MAATASAAMRRLRAGTIVFLAWYAFFASQATVSHALNPSPTSTLGALWELDVVFALLWAALSVAIALWHERVRRRARTVLGVIALHLPMLAVAALVDAVVARVATTAILGMESRISFWAYLVFYSDFDIVSYVAVVAVVEALSVRRALNARQQVTKRLESSLNRARLDYLEAQLQPHFLFNSLGAVSELAYDAPATAARVLRQLIAIFRTALGRKTDEVTLGEEIVGIEPYLDIQRIRFADWLTIDYHVDDAAVDCLLPRFVLQPLIENAVRHGLIGRSSAGTIDITASVRGGTLFVRVADNGAGLDASASSARRGIGLANVRDRLAILYGDGEHLRLSNSAGTGGAVAELVIPVRRRGDPLGVVAGDSPVPSIGDSSLMPLHVPSGLRRAWLGIPVVWLACGLVWTQQSWLYDTLRHRLDSPGWMANARNDMTSALVWALLTPIILALVKRFPLRRTRLPARALGYVVAGVLTTIVHIALLQRLTGRAGSVFAPAWQMSFIVDTVIFAALVTIGHRGMLLEWLRAREAASAMLSAELTAAQERAAKLQSIPPVLLRALNGIATTARKDPAQTERQLTRLGDYLRLALECTDEGGITPERERALDAAVAALRDSGAFSHDLTLIA
jgi:two-component system, LytTR family, sensor kinase